jgi:hypothetical protein|tara:strand:+ start:746 stop:946 length:201 start_codon:yes stop_codon:yes gene_type:complete
MKQVKSILSTLSKSLNGYDSTCWLKASNELLNGKTPAELILDGKASRVEKILPKEIRRIKAKKTNG